jgi:hypothetical protein
MSRPAADAPAARGELWRPSHLCALAALGLVQPALELLARHPPFLVAHRADAALLGASLLILAVALPLLVALLGRALAAFSAARAALFHGLLWLGVQPLGNRLAPPGWLQLALGLLAVVALSWAYSRSVGLRRTLGLLAVSPAVFVAVFLADAQVRPFWRDAEAISAPASDALVPEGTSMVVVLFDELPLVSLLDEQGGIDARSFPHFARLGAESTFYPAATSVATVTAQAVPALLSATYPSNTSAIFGKPDRERTIFRLFGPAAHFDVDEESTFLCPEDLCARRRPEGRLARRLASFLEDLGAVYLHALLPQPWRGGLPPTEGVWHGFWRREASPDSSAETKFRRRLASLDAAPAGSRLVFLHVLLPHHPFELLPGGQRYAMSWFFHFETYEGQAPWERLQIYQRHLLQLQATDGLVGELRARLVELGLWDRSWVVVLADHGASLRPGRHLRGGRDAATLRGDVLPIPLFVKRPQQSAGTIEQRPIELIDVFPTLLAELGVALPWPHDGRADLAMPPAQPSRVAGVLGVPQPEWDAQADALRETLAWKFALPGMVGSHAGDFFALSPRPDLYLRPAETAIPSRHRAYLWARQPWLDYQPDANLVQNFVVGEVVLDPGEAPPGSGAVVAVALGGIVRAIAPLGPLPKLRLAGRQWRERNANPDVTSQLAFSCLLDSGWLKAGRNDLELSLVEETPEGDRWRRLGVVALAGAE